MCIIAVIPEGKKLPPVKNLEECWRTNSDGGGFMYVDKGEVHTRKAKDRDNFLAGLTEYHKEYGADSPFVVHFRAGTKGNGELENIHPFYVNKHTAMVHNGTIMHFSGGELNAGGKSDTHLFAEFLTKLPPDFVTDPTIMKLVESYVTYNKLVFLTDKKEVVFVNKENGTQEGDVWYSNLQYKLSVAGYIHRGTEKRWSRGTTVDCKHCHSVNGVLRESCWNCDAMLWVKEKLPKRPWDCEMNNVCEICGIKAYTFPVIDRSLNKWVETCWVCKKTSAAKRSH